MTPNVELILKEDLSNYHFVHHEVLSSADERKMRNAELRKAMILGNTYKGKVKVIFETEEGIKAIETTIWSSDDTEVTLKGGKNIPVQSIIEVRI